MPHRSPRVAVAVLTTILLAALAAPALVAQDADLQKRVDALERTQQQILQQLQELRAATAPRVAAPRGVQTVDIIVATANSATRGRADAPITVVEFSDFECPFCGRYTKETRRPLEHEYADTGQVRFVFRNLPLPIHPHALRAAEAGECARLQGKFWEMHARLFANQQALADGDLTMAADALGLNGPQFAHCMTGAARAKIQADISDAGRAGASGTPAFLIGRTQPDGSVHAVRRIIGAQPYIAFKTAIDTLLQGGSR